MRPALLVVDLQRRFMETGSPDKLAGVGTLIARTNELIDFFHESRLPVVVIQTVHKADGSTWNLWMREHSPVHMIEGTWEVEQHRDVHMADTDVIIQKTRSSAFIRTQLESVLQGLSIDTVVIAGYSTNFCVGLTAIEAFERDFRVLLAGDAILGTNEERGNRMLNYLQNSFEIELIQSLHIKETISTEVAL